MGCEGARLAAARHRLTENTGSAERPRDPRVRVPPLLRIIAMTAEPSDVERLLAQYRETIIELEAHGSPDERGTLWDVLGAMLADMKRQQSLIQPTDTPSR